MNFKCSIIFAMIFTMCSGCDMSSLAPGADEKFGDQNFKSAVAMIELHRARNGEYPASLSELEYLGDWDAIWLSSVKYEKVENGYNLFVTRGWMGEPKLELPGAYKRGLGIRDTNVTWATEE
jgi:hypothetical protein